MPNQLLILAPAGQLVRGETITVPIVLTLDKRIKSRGIHARFFGAEETKATYTTTSTDAKGNTTTHTHTAVEHVAVVDEKRTLAGGERLGFFRGLMDSAATAVGGGKHESLEPGEYRYEMQVTVPPDAPDTHNGKNTRVFYELSAYVDIPLATDLTAKHDFVLVPAPTESPEPQPVRVSYPGDKGPGFMDKMFAPGVRIELALAADVARPGEAMEGIVIIESDKALAMTALWANFVGIEKSQAQSHHEVAQFASPRVQICSAQTIQGSLSQTFALPYQLVGPPTLQGKKFSVEWFVQVELDVPWAKDPQIRAPIRMLK